MSVHPLFLAGAEFWFDQVVNGLTTGSIYALIALGYTMVYGVLQLINFAHGEVFMVGAFAGYGTLMAFGGEDISGVMILVALIAALVAAGVASAGTAVVIERIAYRPLRNAPRLAPLISAIGVSVFLSHLVDDGFLNGSLMGIDVNRAIVITFALGAVMAGFAGVLYGLFLSSIRGSMGFLPGVKAFTAAVLGGIGSVPGAVVGGYFLGLAETVGRELLNEIPGVNLPNQWKDVIAFALLVLVLIFRPTGIFKQKETKRA